MFNPYALSAAKIAAAQAGTTAHCRDLVILPCRPPGAAPDFRATSATSTQMESDWKKFSAMVPVLRERYLAQRNRAITAILTDPARNETERFWGVMEQMEKEAKALHRCLDGHSRSSLWQSMATMVSVGMLTNEDLAQFSEELQGQLADVPRGK